MAADINFTCDCCGEKILDSSMYHGKAENEYHVYSKSIYEWYGKTKLSADIQVKAYQARDCVCEKCALTFIRAKSDERLKEIENEIRTNSNES